MSCLHRALEWGLPIVTWRWLVDSAHSGKLLPLGPYKTDSPNALDLSHALLPLGLPLGMGGEGAGLPVKGVLADMAGSKQPVLSLKGGRGRAAEELEDVQGGRDQVAPQPPQQARSSQQQQQWQEWQRRQALQQVHQQDQEQGQQRQGQQQKLVGEAGQAWLSQGQVSLVGSACSQLSLSHMLQPSEPAQQLLQQLQQQPQHLIQPLTQQQQQQEASQGVLRLQPGAGAAHGSQSSTQPTPSFSFFPSGPMVVNQDEQAPAWGPGGEELRGRGGGGTSTPAFPGRAPCAQGVQGGGGDGTSGGPAWASWPPSQHRQHAQQQQEGAGDLSGSAAHQQCGKQCGKGGSGVCVSVSPLPMGCEVASPSFGSLPGRGGGSGDDGGEEDVEMSEGHDGPGTRGRSLDDLIIPGKGSFVLHVEGGHEGVELKGWA